MSGPFQYLTALNGSTIIISLILSLQFISCTSHQGRSRDGVSTSCEQILNEAKFRYGKGELDRSIKLIGIYVKCTKEINQRPSLEILEYLSMNYIAKNDYLRAKYWAEVLIYADPFFTPNPLKHPPEFIRLIEGLKSEKFSSDN